MPSSPIATATIQSAILSLISNVLAQAIKAYKTDTPFSLNLIPLITFPLFSLLSTPPNFLWQQALETWFPSYTGSSKPPPSEKQAPKQPPQHLSKLNLVQKFITDQLISAPINNLAFLAFMKYSSAVLSSPVHQQPTAKTILTETLNDFLELHIASLKLWPAVGLISFMFIPVEKRVVFGSLVALGWNIYLGLMVG